MPIPVIVLLAVFVLIAVRRIGRVRLPIWSVMAGGAAAVLTSGQIAPSHALAAIDLDVMVFLFAVFVVGRALEESGYLLRLSYRLFRRARSADALLACVILGAGFASAFLMNDTLAVIGAPLVLLLARQHRMSPKVLLLALAFAVTLGSVPSPIGNPQNLLIALQGGFINPFLEFAYHLALPTLVNLVACFLVLRWAYRESFHDDDLAHVSEPVTDVSLARLARLALGILIGLVALKIVLAFFGLGAQLRLTWIAVAAAAPILLFGKRRGHILRTMDWRTLVFFAAMFVLMESVWESGFVQAQIARAELDIAAIPAILTVSVLASQLISNVPLVALYLPLLQQVGASPDQFLALAAGSTVAGNLFILGAASNVIVIQNAEARGHTLGFLEFARVGIPLTLVNVFVYWLFLVGF